MKKFTWISLLLLLQCTARNQSVKPVLYTDNPSRSNLDSVVDKKARAFLLDAKAPGLIIGISRNGQRTFYSYGLSDSSANSHFTPNTIFEIGSISKTFTANLTWQLQAEKKLEVDKPISDYLPLNGANDEVLKNILIKQVAKHSSGLPRLPGNIQAGNNFNADQPYMAYSKTQLYDFLKELKTAGPGSYQYSNLGFGILGTIAENVTGKNLETLYREYIFSPLKMKYSYVHAKSQKGDSATGYFNKKPFPYWVFDCLAGAGAIKSNANDLLNYLEAHLGTREKKFAAASAELVSSLNPVNKTTSIGYSWHTMEDLAHRVFWHNGGTYGFSTFGAFVPATNTAIIVASNASQVNNYVDRMSRDLLQWLISADDKK